MPSDQHLMPHERRTARGGRRPLYVDVLLVTLLCGGSGLLGYSLARGPEKERPPTAVASETQQAQPNGRPAARGPAPLARLESVGAWQGPTTAIVRFTTAVDKTQAETATNYTVQPDVKVAAAALGADGRSVTLTTSALRRDVDYRLLVANVELAPLALEDTRAGFRYEGTGRVYDGLVLLYGFEEGRGEVVRDISRVGDPVDLRIREKGATAWVAGGLALREKAAVTSDGFPGKLLDGVRASNAITIEAWVRPDTVKQFGPARILTMSAGGNSRNFTLGQEGGAYVVRLRTTRTSENGEPSVKADKTVAEALTHVAYTRDAKGAAKLYVNGEEKSSETIPGELGTWDPAFRIALGNELEGDRHWVGQVHLAAVYARALTADEVKQNFQAGPGGKTATKP